MKIKLLTLALMAFATSVWAKNTTTKVATVNESVTLTEDVDYTITGDTPFGTMGSVNIQNTEHAVLIINKIRPSDVISTWLNSHVYINGEQAVNGTNCQVRMYNRGAIVFPYDKSFKPLTCYTEENYGGETCSNYTEGSSGGFMKTLNNSTLNNKIRSFKLKRGHMVTFAVGTGGWGYSRCFIADLEDLEIPVMPAPFKGTISSYRLFKWWNASKAGVHHTGKDANYKLRTTSCFDWAQGNSSLLPDVEWVPNHIYEDWPSAATCGGVDGSCHMKTNNEPGNSADDHPQDVATVLGNWQNLMRTGMRLCSESSHDGSMGHLKEFIQEIDKRGWRCDILDLHCYWDSGTFNSLNWYSDNYGNGRPIWISEWVWGASWNKNGAFASGRQSEDATYNGTKGIVDVLNSNARVERYFYWNSEAWYTKIVRDDGSLTKLGEYYAKTETGLAYNAQNEYIPKIVFNAPSDLGGTFTKKSGKVELNWTDPNGDMIDSLVIEYKAPGTSKFVKIGNVAPKDKTDGNDVKYTYTTTISGAGMHEFQVKEYYTVGTAKKNFTSETYSVTVASASSVGLVQYGQLKIGDDASVTTDLEAYENAPYVVMGLISNKNSKNGITNQVQSISKGSFKFRFYPWKLEEPVSFDNAETVDYLVLPSDTIFEFENGMMLMSQKTESNIKGAVTRITFPKAFPEGVTPVVVAQQVCSTTSYAPVTVKVSNVTNEGFDVVLVRQEGTTGSFNSQKVNYFACSPGQTSLGGGKLLSAGIDNGAPVYGTTARAVTFMKAAGDTLHLVNPYLIMASQTNNYPATSVLRMSTTTGKDSEDRVISRSVKRQTDPTKTTTEKDAKDLGDFVGYIILSDDPNGSAEDAPILTAIRDVFSTSLKGFSVSTHNGMILSNDKGVQVYNAAGQKVQLNQRVPAGIYVVTNGKTNVKVIVK